MGEHNKSARRPTGDHRIKRLDVAIAITLTLMAIGFLLGLLIAP
jgi:hypothetical protein